MTLRPLDLASPGRAPQVRDGTSPLSSPDLGGPPSLALGRCHRSPGVLVWPSGAIVSSPSRERVVLKPETWAGCSKAFDTTEQNPSGDIHIWPRGPDGPC